MKQLILILMVALNAVAAAQVAFPSVGGNAESGNASISYTVGQLAVGNASNGTSASVNEGVQQSYTTEELKIDGIEKLGYEVSIYPNPTANNVSIQFNQEPQNVRYELYSAGGQLIQEGEIQGTKQNVDMNAYASGSYVLRLVGEEQANGYRIIKK